MFTVVTNTTISQVTKFVYDGDGARVRQVLLAGGKAYTTSYAGATEVFLTGTLRVTRTYYSANGLVAMRVVTSTGVASGVLYFMHDDHLGSTSLASCGNAACGTVGSEVAGSRQSYYPYGSVRVAGVALPTDKAFTGQYSDDSTGLYFYNARYYSPYLNRWIQPDTIVPQPGNPQSLNRYSYVNNRPLNFTDPTGHREDCGNQQCPETTAAEAQQIALRRLILVALSYGVTFTGEGWGNRRVGAVVDALINTGNALLPAYQQAAAADLRNARRLAGSKVSKLDGATVADFRQLTDLNSATDVFKAVYGGLRFTHVDENNADAWAFTDVPVIQFYNGAFNDAQINLFTWHFPTHELGHAFAQRAGRVPYNDLAASGRGALASAGVWHQRRQDSNNEYFADAYLGWAGDHLAANWNNWMNANMPRWIALAVTGN